MALADMSNFPRKKPVSLRDISLRQSISLFYFDFNKLKCYCNNSGNREEHL